MNLNDSHCLVIKVGSALLIDDETQTVNQTWLDSLITDIAGFVQQGKQVVIVSSGAIAYGKLVLGLTQQNLALDQKQAASAVGQIQLTHQYQQLLQQHQITAAQILLTLEDSEHRRRYLNLRNTLNSLLALGVIPIINENDSVTTAEIRYGDNDRLAARVAQMVDADTLVLLSDIDGFYDDDPKLNPQAKRLAVIDDITPEIVAMSKDSSSEHGTGGMITKLAAAKMAVNSGCHLLITHGKPLHPLQHFINTNVGTWFKAKISLQRAKKIWLRDHMQSHGTIKIDVGAAQALLRGASLLPVGVKEIVGTFQKGSPVSIVTEDDREIARGLINYSSHEAVKIIGCASDKIESLLSYQGCKELIHRDHLALF